MRQRDDGKHESLTMGPTLTTIIEECWEAPIQLQIAGMLTQSVYTASIVTNIDALLDFVPIQSMVRHPNGEISRVVRRGCVRTAKNPQTKHNSNAKLKLIFVFLTFLQTSYQSQNARSGDIASIPRKETDVGNSKSALG